ncbi:hypothetical protein [Emiliania huxleyi virus 99B1]|nr:hypothetical protein [Emiliania huxleyi virus 99B1]|mmetsp:Transcript_16732/g.48455  ORF Transcript_16732/g.48455 Transcript_16732/m.48455 type:complete len:130 (-) Transcript_16732:43-432(-)
MTTASNMNLTGTFVTMPIDETVEKKKNFARDTMLIAHADFRSWVRDMEDYMRDIIISAQSHNEFEYVTRSALNEVFFITNIVISETDIRYNTADATTDYTDLCEIQSDRIKLMRDTVQSKADEIEISQE